MVKNFKFIIFILFLLFQLFAIPFALSPTYAACNPSIPGNCPAGLTQIRGLFSQLISIFVGLGFVVMFVMIVWAGFKYLTSGGEPKQIQAAHNVVSWAFLGIIFMAVAWLVLQLIQLVTGTQITNFDIGILCRTTPGGIDWCDPNQASPSATPAGP